MIDKLARFVAWKVVPKRVAYWAFMRVMATATQQLPAKSPSEISWDQAAKAWVARYG